MLQLHRCEPSVGLVEKLMFGVCFLNSLSLCIPSDLPFAAPSPPEGHVALCAMARTDTAPTLPYPEPTALGSFACCHPLVPHLPQLQPGRSLAAPPWIERCRGESSCGM